MKICLISNLYPPYNRGGAEQVVKNTVEGMISRGHQVVVITAAPFKSDLISPPAGDLPKGDKSQIPNLSIYRFFPWNIFFYGNDYKYPAWMRFFWHILDVFNLYSFFKVRAILKKEQPDVVHTHNLKGIGFLVPLAIRSLGLRQVHTLHDVQLVEPSGIIIKGQENNWRYNGWPIKLYTAINRWLFGSPQVVISPSKFLLEFYEKRGFFPQSKKIILPNPVVSVGAPTLRRSACPVADKNNEFNFLYLGQIEEHKGVLFLIKAFKKLCSSVPALKCSGVPVPACPACLPVGKVGRFQCSLHIVGSGSKLAEAKKLAEGSPQIIFHGKAERGELPKIFSLADVTVVPSLCYENSPTVIFESFSFGVPVLASSIEGVAELIRNNENGWTFEAGNPEKLAQKMSWCLANQPRVLAMRQSVSRSVEGLDLAGYLDKLLSLCYNR